MFTTRKSSQGFTIIELLIVVVIIAILAAITIVSYNGITQKATTASINSTVQTWSTYIQTTNIKSGFKFSGDTCLANSINDYPATNGFAAGVCVMVDSSGPTLSYDPAVFASWPSDQVRPFGNLPVTQVTISGSVIKARGIWITSRSSTGFEARWVPQVGGQCGIGVSGLDIIAGSLTGGYCGATINYQS